MTTDHGALLQLRSDETSGHTELNERELTALVRRYERFAVDVDQRLKDIVLLLQHQREASKDDRARIDELERREAARPIGPPAPGTVTRRDKAARRR